MAANSYDVKWVQDLIAAEGLIAGVLGLGEAALKREEDEIGAAADAEFIQEIRNVEFDGALGDVEPAGDLFVGKILEKRIEDFLFAAAEVSDRIGLEAAPLACEDGIDKAREQLARHPEPAVAHERQSANQLVTRFRVCEESFHTKPEKRVAIGIIVFFADHDEAGFGIAFENIGEQSAGSGARSMSVNDVDLCGGRLHVAEVRRKHGSQLLRDHFKLRLFQKPFELAQHKGVRREDTDG